MGAEDPAGTAAAVAGPAVPRPRGGPPPLAIFGLLLAIFGLSIGASLLLLAGAGRAPSNEPAPTALVEGAAPASTASPAAATTSDRVRVLSAGGSSTPTDGGAHRVTFTWTLEGARENDPAEIHFYIGNQLTAREQGTLDPSLFSFASGTLTFVTEQECSTSGWSADLVTIRGVLVDGDGIAVVPGVRCQ